MVVFRATPNPNFRALAFQALVDDHQRLKHTNRNLNEEIGKAAYDSLTGLRRSTRFVEDGERLARRIWKNGGKAAVLFCDANDLKTINDQSEDKHSSGNLQLRAIGEELEAHLRTTDVTGRLGGDEFTAVMEVLPTYNDEALQYFGKNLRTRINQAVVERTGMPDAISVGITFWEPGQPLDDALQTADRLMYKDKAELKQAT